MNFESVLFLCTAFLGANLFDSNFISPYLGHGNTLVFHVGALIGWLVFWWIGRNSAGARPQFWLAVVFVTVFVGGAFTHQLNLRGATGNPIGIHDGAVQVEVAAEKLLHGQNPYAADYRGTKYETLNPIIPGGPSVNVVWSHFIYPPGVILWQTPLSWLGQILGFVPDARWMFMIALIALTWLVVRYQPTWHMKTRLLLLTAGNPLIWLYVVAGYNDILLVAALGGAAVAWAGKRWMTMGVLFGIALGVKQSAWLALPLFAWVVWQLWHQNRGQARRIVIGTVVATGVIYLPFIIWNAGALYDNIVRYASGAIPFSYPISGTTLAQYLYVWGFIASPWQVVSLWWAQAVVGGAVTIGLIRWLGKKPLPANWVAAVAMVITAVLLVSRYNNNNYLSAMIGLSVVAYGLNLRAHDQS